MPVLPPAPSTFRLLLPEEVKRLAAEHADLPKKIEQCVTCLGKKTFRWLSPDDPTEIVTWDCNCPAQWTLHRYLLHSGLGLHYQRIGWDDVQAVEKATLDVVLDYGTNAEQYASVGQGLILHGKTTGTGKTMCAALLFKSLLAAGLDGYFVQFNEMLDAFTGGWRDAEARAWFTARVRNAGVLVVDDIGRENKGRIDVAEAMFDTVIRARHDNERPTIITTNLTMDEIRKGYSGNVMSLLSGTCFEHEVTGTDFRPQERARRRQQAALGLRRPIVVG